MNFRSTLRRAALTLPPVRRLVSNRDSLISERDQLLQKLAERDQELLKRELEINPAGATENPDFKSDSRATNQAIGGSSERQPYIYFGNLFPHEPQFHSGLFRALALYPRFERDIEHDIRNKLPFPDESIQGFQSQDVFEHVPFDAVSGILDDIFRCLMPGGIFRLSLPDYNSPLLKSRSVYDAAGHVLYDAAMGGSVVGHMTGGLQVSFPDGGDAHLWFPTYTNVLELIVSSDIRKCSNIEFIHHWINSTDYLCKDFDQSIMPVQRTPPNDMRAEGKPISIVIDFVK